MKKQSRDLQTSTSTTPSSQLPKVPEPVASRSPQRTTREKRRGPRGTGPRSIAHNGATCDNDLCDAPTISADERLCPGPGGLQLCSRCYKRFKIERRRAREAQRTMTDEWKKPKARRPELDREFTGDSRPLPTISGNRPRLDRSQESSKSRVEQVRAEAPIYGRRSQQPPAPANRRQESEKSASLHNFPTSSRVEYDQKTSRSPRRHRSRHASHPHYERDGERRTRNSYAESASPYEEKEFYKFGRSEEDGRSFDDGGCCCGLWNRRRKCVMIVLAVISVIVLIIIITLAVMLTRKSGFNYVPSNVQVNNTLAFESGGATRDNVNDTSIGIGAGTDSYTYYQGNASQFPPKERWISFQDMWDNNLDTFKYSCGWLGHGDDNTPEIIQDIYDAIQDRANASLVDHRIILATIIQETNGCPLNPSTTSSGGTRNPGLMQSHNGHAYDAQHSRLSILQMVQDGTQGTEHGWGLVDNLNTYGNPYKAMRSYNSGYIPDSGDLSEEAGATACYVSDMANRLTGWVRAQSLCPDNTH